VPVVAVVNSVHYGSVSKRGDSLLAEKLFCASQGNVIVLSDLKMKVESVHISFRFLCLQFKIVFVQFLKNNLCN
jgi:hypothetical protein